MGGGVDAGQMVEGDLGVELGGFQTAMAQQGLDDPDVGAALEHVGGAGVAEQVAGAGFFDLGLLEQAFDAGREGASAEAGALVGEEQRGFAVIVSQAWPAFLLVTCDPGQGARSQRHGLDPTVVSSAATSLKAGPVLCSCRARTVRTG